MHSKFVLSALTLSISLVLTGGYAFAAAGSALQQAVAEYNLGQYASSLEKLTLLERESPNYPMVHYYAALCKQNLNQTAEAKAEYEWLISGANNNSLLRNYAQRGLYDLSHRSTSYAPSHLGGAGSVSSPHNNVRNTVAASHPASDYGAPGGVQSRRVKKVIEFYTDWCSVCKKFEPSFQQAKSATPGVEFVQLNMDDEQNKPLVSQYRIVGPPSLVFLDDSNNVLFSRPGCPKSAGDLMIMIQRFY